jgi:hypothetical protein
MHYSIICVKTASPSFYRVKLNNWKDVNEILRLGEKKDIDLLKKYLKSQGHFYKLDLPINSRHHWPKLE